MSPTQALHGLRSASVCAATLLLSLSSNPAGAQGSAALQTALQTAQQTVQQTAVAATQTVTTVASREPLPLQLQVADVLVFSRDQLQALPTDNLADALQILAGVQVSRTGGSGQPTSVLMRGAATANTLVLVDGVRMGSASLGQFDFAGLGLSGIERIEVLRGPGATLHGADAVGGVVLVTTRNAQAGSGASASMALGQLGGREGALRLRRAGTNWDAQLQLASEASTAQSAVRPGDRFGIYNPDADGFVRRTVALGGGWSPAAGHRVDATVHASRLFSRYDSADYPPPNYEPDPSPDFATRTATQAAQVSYLVEPARGWNLRLSVGHGAEDSRSGASTTDRYQTTRSQRALQVGWQPHGDHRWTLGWDALTEDVQATGYAARASRDNGALVLAYGGRWGAVQVQADARQDRNSVYGDHETGRTGLRWAVSPDTALRMQAATTFRAPSFNDLYYPGYGVSTLKPESGRSVEVGTSTRAGAARLEATAWRQSVDNLIAYSGDPGRCPASAAYAYGCAANIGRAKLRGLTLELAPLPSAGTPAAASPGSPGTAASMNSGAPSLWRLGYDLTDARDGDGQPLPRRARHQVRAHGEQSIAGWRVGSALLWQSTRREGSVALKGGTKLDLQAQRPLGMGWSVQARLLNALDADIEPARDYRAPGRQAWLGMRWDGQ